jgi:hypothetical protein
MNQTLNKLNGLQADTVLCIGVGVPSVFFNRLRGNVTGFDRWEHSNYPHSWTIETVADNIINRKTKKKFDLVIINSSKHYEDLLRDFSQAQKNCKEGGIIAVTHTMPKTYFDVQEEPLPRQDWSGFAWQLVLDIISLGGYKVTSYDFDKGLTFFEIDETKESRHVEIGAWEDWLVQREKLMSNH